ncbi:hypothetical protein A9237_11345 [Vibrio owensii]|nr:hypothetical protein A9237_11345 [Vibrio owensii]
MFLGNEKREARSEKREARSEKREARSEKREARSELILSFEGQIPSTPFRAGSLSIASSRFIKRSAPESPSTVFFSSNKKTADESAVFIIQRSRKITFSF